MTYPGTFKYILSKTIHNLWSIVSGIPSDLTKPRQNEMPGEIFSQRHEITCKCGWHGKGSDSLREYSVLSEETVELKLFCKECRNYLGYIIYKDAA
ncbi:hypothetical protein OCK74_23070 [Chitinophagaceae bacterium LB-8]|uniref:Uncharacterized protein n=1 Tax=Paraflavisolibacter caeni TaxID=2982496 RepID=A0A9X3BA08_9BACT|nr:hypothetical protein [Paraflavisolibacter caeni]MCU7552021.1 hypothetical protein [Paraflavisolibacter caeni]